MKLKDIGKCETIASKEQFNLPNVFYKICALLTRRKMLIIRLKAYPKIEMLIMHLSELKNEVIMWHNLF